MRSRGLASKQRLDVEDRIRRELTDRAMATIRIAPRTSIVVLLSNGTQLPAEVVKFSPPTGLDAHGTPLQDSGRDLALLRVKSSIYPALNISTKDRQIGDAVHILGFRDLIFSHELLSKGSPWRHPSRAAPYPALGRTRLGRM